MFLQKDSSRSFIKNITVASVGYLGLMVIILSAVWWNTGRTLEDNAKATITQSLAVGQYEIDEILKANEQALAVVLQDNDSIRVFEYGTENQRAVASQNMIQIIQKAASTSTDVSSIFFYDLIGGNFIAKFSENLPHSDVVLIEDAIRKINDETSGNMPSAWFYQKIGDRDYLLRLYKNRKRMLGALVQISDFNPLFETNEAVVYSLLTSDGQLIAQYGIDEKPGKEIFEVEDIERARWSIGNDYYFVGADSPRGEFSLFVSLSQSKVYGSFQVMQLIILLLVIAAIGMLLGLSFYTRKVVYRPLSKLLSAMKKIENGDRTVRLPKDAQTVEFKQINTSFNQMMDTIVNLRMRSYEERIQFDEATLKYVQLQIKPHFFLNALTTIHSMSYQDKNEEIREYIERLSRNVRYLFKSGLHTVPLSEEIEHARDYIGMQEILYPGCVFDFIDVDKELMDYPIPQLLIHTILENIYKHAVSVDKLTSILISAKLDKYVDEEMCHIVVEDDGEGFPQEFLDQVKEGNIKVKENGHGVGLWNLKKTLSLMYRRDDLMEFSNKEPSGTRVDIYVPRRVKRQSSVWKLS
ncbi:MAG: histidine kinase [Butyrivibrio sp.]|nr:histidine kinase [Butyrivibrio sp.]